MLIQQKCKICRRLGQKILWNERCASNKCALSRRRTRPGMHGYKPRNLSDYAKKLIEKQKIRYFYLLKEKQLRNFIEKAKKKKELLASTLIKILESKIDNVIWRLGYTTSKLQARQLVTHGHFLVNGKRVKTPSYLLKPGDIIEIRPQSKNLAIFQEASKRIKLTTLPSWLKIHPNDLKGEFLRYPELEEVNLPFNINLALQFYRR